MLAVAELMDRLGIIEALDTGIGPIKARARGVTGGELVAGLAQCQLLDGKFVAALDRHRADTAAQMLSAVPAVASTTAGGWTRCLAWMHRFAVVTSVSRLCGIEMGVGVVDRPTFCVGLFHWIFRVAVGGSGEG